MSRPRVNQRGLEAYNYAEAALCPGPAAGIGISGGGTRQELFSGSYALLHDADSLELILLRQVGSSWIDVSEQLPNVLQGQQNVRRISIQFDQAARPTVAFEDDEGNVRITRWDTTEQLYLQNVTFAAIQPAVFIDALITGIIAGSDVWVVYTKLHEDSELAEQGVPDGNVYYRLQSDRYLTEYTLYSHGEPLIIDKVAAVPLRYQIHVSRASGDVLDDREDEEDEIDESTVRLALTSELYPYQHLMTPLAVDYEWQDGVYFQIAQAYTHLMTPLAVDYEWQDGAYREIISEYPVSAGIIEQMSVAVGHGLYADVAVEYEHAMPPLFVDYEWQDGDYSFVAGIFYEHSLELGIDYEWQDGSYELA